jgi:chorismate synthase
MIFPAGALVDLVLLRVPTFGPLYGDAVGAIADGSDPDRLFDADAIDSELSAYTMNDMVSITRNTTTAVTLKILIF